jgi:hypothetical protein
MIDLITGREETGYREGNVYPPGDEPTLGG